MKKIKNEDVISAKRTCAWTEDEYGDWQTGCGKLFEFSSDGPTGDFRFCPFCGLPIRFVKYQEEVEDAADS